MLPPGVEAGEVGTLVAFGSLAGAGASPPVTLAGGAGFYAWGAWPDGTRLFVDRSADAGATWTPAATFDGSAMSPYQDARPHAVTAAGLYRVRLDAPFPGGVVTWACYQ
jgi:hypothetical protein